MYAHLVENQVCHFSQKATLIPVSQSVRKLGLNYCHWQKKKERKKETTTRA